MITYYLWNFTTRINSLGLVVVAATVRATKSFVSRETVSYFVSYYNTEGAKIKYKILSNLV